MSVVVAWDPQGYHLLFYQGRQCTKSPGGKPIRHLRDKASVMIANNNRLRTDVWCTPDAFTVTLNFSMKRPVNLDTWVYSSVIQNFHKLDYPFIDAYLSHRPPKNRPWYSIKGLFPDQQTQCFSRICRRIHYGVSCTAAWHETELHVVDISLVSNNGFQNTSKDLHHIAKWP